MNRIILQLFAVGLCFAIGHALQCYQCKLGLWNLCITTTTTCGEGQHCYSGVGSAAGLVDVKMKGCLAVALCNKTSGVDMSSSSNSTLYEMTKTCCSTDLCNAAPGLPGASAASLALATLTALLTANFLV